MVLCISDIVKASEEKNTVSKKVGEDAQVKQKPVSVVAKADQSQQKAKPGLAGAPKKAVMSTTNESDDDEDEDDDDDDDEDEDENDGEGDL